MAASEETMFALKQQFQRNAGELQSYLSDLDDWTKDMERKDAQLKNKAPPMKEPETKPAKGAKAGSEKEPETKVVETQKIKSHEYDKWDKFDVDRVLADIDKVPKITELPSGGSLETPEQLLQRAVAEKERGNEHFRRGQYLAAADCYTRGMEFDPRNALLPANRAMALLKLNRFGEAEADCTLAISLDGTYVKAFQRRATARSRLKRVPEAIRDYEKVVELEPKNKQARLELEKLKKMEVEEEKPVMTKKEEKLEPGASFSDNIKAAFSAKKREEKSLEPGQILPVQKAPHQRSKKPLRRVEIVENTEMREIKTTKLEVGEEERIKILDVEGESNEIVHMKEEEVKKRVQIEEIGKTTEVIETEPAPEPSEPPKTELQSKVEEEISARLEATALTRKKLPPKPRTAAQFVAAWRVLPAAQRPAYLLQLRAEDYPKVFKHSLEPELFGAVLSALGESGAEVTTAHLSGLSRVPRVAALIMFMGEEEKEVVRALLHGKQGKEVERLRKVFEV